MTSSSFWSPATAWTMCAAGTRGWISGWKTCPPPTASAYSERRLEQWAHGFADPREPAYRLRASRYPFMLTRDAGSISVEMGPNNLFRRDGHMLYNKAYNINHDLFWTPLKSYSTFDNGNFEGLGFSQPHIDKCTQVNRHGPTASDPRESHFKRSALVHTYETCKGRVAVGLRDSTAVRSPGSRPVQSSFGIRSECRVSLTLLQQTEFSDRGHSTTIPREAADHPTNAQAPSSGMLPADTVRAPPTEASERAMLSADNMASVPPADHDGDASDAGGSHRSYWVISTKEVNRFTSAGLNRWVFCLEASASRACGGPHHRVVVPEIQQRLHGITISACRRILALALGGTTRVQQRALWLDRLESKEHRRQRMAHQRREDHPLRPASTDVDALQLGLEELKQKLTDPERLRERPVEALH